MAFHVPGLSLPWFSVQTCMDFRGKHMDALQGKGWPDREIAGLWHRPCTMAIAVALALGLSGCGGGGNVKPTPPPTDGSGFAGGAVNVGSSDIITWSANISGSIDLIKDGTGTLVLTGTDSYSGGTTINLGTLQLGNGGTTGSIIGNVLDNGSLVFDRSDDVIFAGIVSGNGSLEQAGTGRLTLTGDSTYTGGTTISHGILQLGNGGYTGSIVGDVTDNGSLVFNRSDDVIFGGIVSGSGSLVKTGGKLLTLTGANTYAGGTTVEGGTLEIASGAALGTGSVTVGSYAPDYFYNATLKIDSGVSLSNHIVLGNSGTLDNAGALAGNQDNVIGSDGTNLTVLNHDGGSIIGTGSAVSLDSVGTVNNSSGGIIQGGNLGVKLGRAGNVSNDGIGSSIRSSAGIAVQILGDVGTPSSAVRT